jgi:hypothetical protein
MGEIKSRSIRLDDENWEWLAKLPGRTSNDAVGDLRFRCSTENATTERDMLVLEITGKIDETLELARSLPDAVTIEETVRRVIQEFKAQKAGTSSAPAGPVGFPIQCGHCGRAARGATKFATICMGCKGDGHSNEPRDCPKCTLDYGTGAL